jgi:hypothetical protein
MEISIENEMCHGIRIVFKMSEREMIKFPELTYIAERLEK